MEKTKREKADSGSSSSSRIGGIGEDNLQTIVSKLPAKSFASAACVSRSWNSACRRVLFQPKFSSAVSLDANLRCAIEEVVDEILSEPIRPHFAILCISPLFSLPLAHKYITEKLCSSIPVVSCKSRGVMGNNALTNEFEEIQSWAIYDETDCLTHGEPYAVSLTVGFVPGLKVDALPLLRSEDYNAPCIDTFAIDIRKYANSVSGSIFPTGMIMFGDQGVDMKPVLEKIEFSMHPDTFIVGDAYCSFFYRAVGDAGNFYQQTEQCAGVALLFMKDGNKPRDIGDIQFHVAISPGMVPIGQTYKAAAVIEKNEESETWISATKGENLEYINGETMRNDVEEELGELAPDLFIGVTKRRNSFVGSDKPRWLTSMSFHQVSGGDETYLYVRDLGIERGDTFSFYHEKRSRDPLPEDLGKLKQGIEASSDKRKAFGGFIFSCCSDFEYGDFEYSFAKFFETFPEVTLGGLFCDEVIKRDYSSLYNQESEEQRFTRCSIHRYSNVYLVMSYTPPLLENQI